MQNLEQFINTLLGEAGISVSSRYKNDLIAALEQRIRIVITDAMNNDAASSVANRLEAGDMKGAEGLLMQMPGLKQIVEKECLLFRAEYLNALHA